MLCRYAELVTGFLFFTLATARVPPLRPAEVLEPDHPPSFGIFRTTARTLAVEAPHQESGWVPFVAELLRDPAGSVALERINADRNAIAHGRAGRPPAAIRQDLAAFVRAPAWEQLRGMAGTPPTAELRPWVWARAAAAGGDGGQAGQLGVLDRWNDARHVYLVPGTGETFRVTTAEVAAGSRGPDSPPSPA
jgi:hypothetical protein